MGWGCDGMTHRCLQGPRALAQTGQRLCTVTQGCAGVILAMEGASQRTSSPRLTSGHMTLGDMQDHEL